MILIVLLMIPLISFAQKESAVKFGIRVAPGIGWMRPNTEGYESAGIRAVISAGLISDFYFAKNYAISTGFSVLFPSGKMDYRDSVLYNNSGMVGDVHSIYNLIYFEIPLMLKMKTNQFGKFSVYAQVGIGTGFAAKSKAISEFTPASGGEPFESEIDINNKTTLMRESIIVGGGIEYHIDESTRLLLGINYSNSLHNIYNSRNLLTNEEVNAYPNFAELSIGVIF